MKLQLIFLLLLANLVFFSKTQMEKVSKVYGENDIDTTRFVQFLEDCNNQCEENRQICARSCQFKKQDQYECNQQCKLQLASCAAECNIKVDDYKMADLDCHEYMVVCLQDTCYSYDPLVIKKCMKDCEDKKAICYERKQSKQEL